MQPCEPQPGIASADIAAESHLSVGLRERAKGKGAMRPGSNHGAKLEPAGAQCRINFLPAVLARDVRVTKPRAPKATRSRSFADSLSAVARNMRKAQRREFKLCLTREPRRSVRRHPTHLGSTRRQ